MIIANRTIFIIQIVLLLLLATTFTIGYSENGVQTGSFFYGILMGAIGASVSLMRRINAGDKVLVEKLTNDKVFSILRPILYGTLMAGVIYLMFMSGILSGDNGGGLFTTNLFPNFTKPDENLPLVKQFVNMIPVGMKNSGKLLVWCFIAGYSERFVAGFLDQLEAKAQSKKDA